jgi:DNA-binding NarL/FixJ family response regulator
MAYTNATRRTRAAIREAALVSRRRKLDEARANLRSLKAFLTANRRLLEVDVWLDEKLADLHATAESRRATHRQDAATALADMAARGMSVEEIARMAGMTTETVHNYLTRSA